MTALSSCLLGLAFTILIIWIWRALYPKPYPGIPYNQESANRITGDIPDLVPIIKASNESSNSIFDVTTRNLGVPMAQLLFPGIRKPLIILEDPRETEDILLRRNKEFDKSLLTLDMLSPMFPKATVSQLTTPHLKIQKRMWADSLSFEFLRKTAAPRAHQAILDLLNLWTLKAKTIYKDQPFKVHDDLQNTTLDIIWVAITGQEAGITKYEIDKFQNQIDGNDIVAPLPRGSFLRDEVTYISETVAKNASSPFLKWSQWLETWTPRYRQFRATITREISQILRHGVERFERLELGNLKAGEYDTCMMDLVLRRQLTQARKANVPLLDPTKDESMIQEMFTILFGGHDSTANTLTWFIRFMEAYPAVQTELRAILKASFPGDDQPSAQEILGANIPYLDAVVEESFRFSGTTKANIRQALVDTQILGHTIPKGADILMNYHINYIPVLNDESKRSPASRDAAVKRGDGLRGKAGHELETFNPRRWLAVSEKTGGEVFDRYALPTLAFGGGYRGCPGHKLASLEFRIAVVLFILNLEFLDLPDELRSMNGREKLFREPQLPYVKIKVL